MGSRQATQRSRRIVGALAAAVLLVTGLPGASRAIVDAAAPATTEQASAAARPQSPKAPARELITGWAGLAKGAPVAHAKVHVLDMAGNDITAEVTGIPHPAQCRGAKHRLCTNEAGNFGLDLLPRKLPAHYIIEVRGGTILGKPARGSLMADVVDNPDKLRHDITLGTSVEAQLVAHGMKRADAVSRAKVALGLPSGARLDSTLMMTPEYLDGAKVAPVIAGKGGVDKAVATIVAAAKKKQPSMFVTATQPKVQSKAGISPRGLAGFLTEGVAGYFLDMGLDQMMTAFGYKSATDKKLEAIQDELADMHDELDEMHKTLDALQEEVAAIETQMNTALDLLNCTKALELTSTTTVKGQVQKISDTVNDALAAVKNIPGNLNGQSFNLVHDNFVTLYTAARQLSGTTGSDTANLNHTLQEYLFGTGLFPGGLVEKLQEEWAACASPVNGVIFLPATADANASRTPSWVTAVNGLIHLNYKMALIQSAYLKTGVPTSDDAVTYTDTSVSVDFSRTNPTPRSPAQVAHAVYVTNYLTDALLRAALPPLTSVVPPGEVYIYDAGREASNSAVAIKQVASNSANPVTPANANLNPAFGRPGLANGPLARSLLAQVKTAAATASPDTWLTSKWPGVFPVNGTNAPLNYISVTSTDQNRSPKTYTNVSKNVWVRCGGSSACTLAPNVWDQLVWYDGSQDYTPPSKDDNGMPYTTSQFPVNADPSVDLKDILRVGYSSWHEFEQRVYGEKSTPFVGFMNTDSYDVTACPFAGLALYLKKNGSDSGTYFVGTSYVGGQGVGSCALVDGASHPTQQVPALNLLVATDGVTGYPFGYYSPYPYSGWGNQIKWTTGAHDNTWSTLVTGDKLTLNIDGRASNWDDTGWQLAYGSNHDYPAWAWKSHAYTVDSWASVPKDASVPVNTYVVEPIGRLGGLPSTVTIPATTDFDGCANESYASCGTKIVNNWTNHNVNQSVSSGFTWPGDDPGSTYSKGSTYWGKSAYFGPRGDSITGGTDGVSYISQIARCTAGMIAAGKTDQSVIKAYCGWPPSPGSNQYPSSTLPGGTNAKYAQSVTVTRNVYQDPDGLYDCLVNARTVAPIDDCGAVTAKGWLSIREQYMAGCIVDLHRQGATKENAQGQCDWPHTTEVVSSVVDFNPLFTCISAAVSAHSSNPAADCLTFTIGDQKIAPGSTLLEISTCTGQMIGSGHGGEADGFCSWPPSDGTTFSSFADLYTCWGTDGIWDKPDFFGYCAEQGRARSASPSPTASPSPSASSSSSGSASGSDSGSSSTDTNAIGVCAIYKALLTQVSSTSLIGQLGSFYGSKVDSACAKTPAPTGSPIGGVTSDTLYAIAADLLSLGGLTSMCASLSSSTWVAPTGSDATGRCSATQRSGVIDRSLMLADARMSVIAPILAAAPLAAARTKESS